MELILIVIKFTQEESWIKGLTCQDKGKSLHTHTTNTHTRKGNGKEK